MSDRVHQGKQDSFYLSELLFQATYISRSALCLYVEDGCPKSILNVTIWELQIPVDFMKLFFSGSSECGCIMYCYAFMGSSFADKVFITSWAAW